MGWITGQWEDQNPKPNKPRRRFYRITPTGTVESRQVLTERRPQALRRERRTMPGWVYALRPGDVA
jgi:DNA-binding PadR family transcriptional regulator